MSRDRDDTIASLTCWSPPWLGRRQKAVINIVIPGELPRRERRRIFLVWWVLAVLWRSQDMCLGSESREVLWVKVVNIGAVFREWWLILWAEFIILSSNFLVMLTKYVLIRSSRSNYEITIHYRFTALLTLLLHHVAAMSFIPLGKWGVDAASVLEDWERRRKRLEDRCRT